MFNETRMDYEEPTGYSHSTLDHMPENELYVAVMDGVQLVRHSHKIPGAHWLKNPRTLASRPDISRPTFLHLAALQPPTEEG